MVQFIKEVYEYISRIGNKNLNIEILTSETKGEFSTEVQVEDSTKDKIICMGSGISNDWEEAEDLAFIDLFEKLKKTFPLEGELKPNLQEVKYENQTVKEKIIEDHKEEENNQMMSYQKAFDKYTKIIKDIYATSYQMDEAFDNLKKHYSALPNDQKKQKELPFHERRVGV